VAASRPRSLVDGAAMGGALLGVSTPVFWLGLILILVFAAKLRWFPVGGYGTPAHLVLPAVTLAAVSAGTIARMTRSSVLEMASREFVRAARARGLSKGQALVRHAFRNALLPVITVIGLDLAGLLGGAVATETIFSWPGLGRAIMDAVRARDVPVVEGGVLFLAAVFVAVNLAVDLLYAVLDPRVRESMR
jgi:peptide/nickel transport system permease protein